MPLASSSIDAAVFRDFCARFASGVTITTVLDTDGQPQGLTASSFTSVSLSPPLILVCINHNSGVLRHFRNASHFAVNILHAGQQELSNRFAVKATHRFDGIPWSPGPAGSPLLDECLAHIECATQQIVDAGDHAVFFGEVIAAQVNENSPLLYYHRGYHILGGAP
ncbi:MAG: flavin reductase family protein [Bryobacterales bacterium]|nr:flavin reductase family protein [Bryobacterales bacterium]